MSFISYKYFNYLGYDEKTKLYSYEYEVTDSEWVGVAVGVGVEVVEIAIINAYEKRKLPVAPNLVLAFQYIAKRYGRSIKQVINWNKKYNPKYPKYEQEILQLLGGSKTLR